MKKFLLSAAALLSIASCPATTKQALTLYMESGAKIVYFLESEPTIGFADQQMIVTVDSHPTDIPMQDVERWEIGMAEYDALNAIKESSNASVAVEGTTVRVHNPEATIINIYNTAGQKVGSDQNIEASFSLPQGIYIINVGKDTFKIAIR